MKTHPPVNPMTNKPYDSVAYMDWDKEKKEFKRVAIYDAGQIYPEYIVMYKRVTS